MLSFRYFGGSLELISLDGWGTFSHKIDSLLLTRLYAYVRHRCILKATQAGKSLEKFIFYRLLGLMLQFQGTNLEGIEV
jgi:hypothetical protein